MPIRRESAGSRNPAALRCQLGRSVRSADDLDLGLERLMTLELDQVCRRGRGRLAWVCVPEKGETRNNFTGSSGCRLRSRASLFLTRNTAGLEVDKMRNAEYAAAGCGPGRDGTGLDREKMRRIVPHAIDGSMVRYDGFRLFVVGSAVYLGLLCIGRPIGEPRNPLLRTTQN